MSLFLLLFLLTGGVQSDSLNRPVSFQTNLKLLISYCETIGGLFFKRKKISTFVKSY